VTDIAFTNESLSLLCAISCGRRIQYCRRWSRDVTEYIARELRDRCACGQVPASLQNFQRTHA
jgi:hypothetical protein